MVSNGNETKKCNAQNLNNISNKMFVFFFVSLKNSSSTVGNDTEKNIEINKTRENFTNSIRESTMLLKKAQKSK